MGTGDVGARGGVKIQDSVGIYTEFARAERWLSRFQGLPWSFACTVAFTETALWPGISAAGQTPSDRRWTAYADAEFLVNGLSKTPPLYPLPPLEAGLSPVLISRALTEIQGVSPIVIDAGLGSPTSLSISPSAPPSVLQSSEPRSSELRPAEPRPRLAAVIPTLDLGNQAARCLSTGNAMAFSQVQHLLRAGLIEGKKLAQRLTPSHYLVLGECVVGGTTTALGLLMGLGVEACGRVNSSHPRCNHEQKLALVRQGLAEAGFDRNSAGSPICTGIHTDGQPYPHPLQIAAALGDPMQVVVAGIAIAASHQIGVLLAGGTQMLAVYSLIAALEEYYHHCCDWSSYPEAASLPEAKGNEAPEAKGNEAEDDEVRSNGMAHELADSVRRPNWEQIVVGTTRWVAEDPTGDTVGLAEAIAQRFDQSPAPILLATQLSFSDSRHSALRLYEAGFVKEGVGAGGCAIATSLHLGWNSERLGVSLDQFCDRYARWQI